MKLFLNRNIAILFTCLVVTIASAADQAVTPQRRTIALDPPWNVQPASGVDSPPLPDAWGRTDSMSTAKSWQFFGQDASRGTSWQGSKLNEVNSLWYEKEFDLPARESGQRVLLDFSHIDGEALIFLNGKEAGMLLDPLGEIDVTDAANWAGKNQLRIFLTRETNLAFNLIAERAYLSRIRSTANELKQKDRWPLGIVGPVEVVLVPSVSVRDVFIQTSWREKKISFEVTVNAAEATGPLEISAEILDRDGKPALRLQGEPVKLAIGESVHSLTGEWKDARTWEIEASYLYTARVSISKGGQVIDRFLDVSFGFREVWTEGKELILNGHPVRLRLTELYGTDKNGLSLYQLIGFNAGEIQPHANRWGIWHNMSTLDEDVLAEADRSGMAILAPAPSVSYLGNALLKDEALQESYRRIMSVYTKRYRNHPSILAWAVGMNSYNPRSNIDASTLGKRENEPHEKGVVVGKACEIGKKVDPTRLFFSHADGGVGDLSTANVYLNFAPLQEREEWPIEWARNGDMPYAAVEFGILYSGNFWKKKTFLMTEYTSMYFGDAAYESEGVEGLKNTLDWGLKNTGHGAFKDVDLGQYPSYWDMNSLFAKATNRSWRTWGVNGGWLYWNLYDYGISPYSGGRSQPYRNFPEPLTKKPEWANERFDIHSQANQTLLAYLAGSPSHTDKTHSFFSGEAVEKLVAVVWDGSHPRTLQARWTLKSAGDVADLASGELDITVEPGDIAMRPISFTMPKVNERKDVVLSLTVTDGGKIVAEDSLSLQAFPVLEPFSPPISVAVLDPSGKSSSWLDTLGVSRASWKPGDSLKGVDILVIGREALAPGARMPWSLEDLDRGLRILILEQSPVVWEQLGFHTLESMSRYTFIRDSLSPVVDGLKPADFINWRGTPNLLPEGRWAKLYDSMHAPKWTNTHAVASVVLETPETVGFTPILEADFAMAFSPLLEFRHGKGSIYFCSLDLTSRVGTDPAATRLASNLLASMQSEKQSALQPVYYEGNDEGQAFVEALGPEVRAGGLKAARQSGSNSLLVVGQGASAELLRELGTFAQEGGTVFYLPQSTATLESLGLRTQKAEFLKVPMEKEIALTRGIGPNLLRWRDVLTVDRFEAVGQPAGVTALFGGIALERVRGKGREIFVQVGPGQLLGRYPEDKDRTDALQISISALWRLNAQLLTNAGANSSKTLANSLTQVAKPRFRQELRVWSVLGPFFTKETDGKALLDSDLPGLQDAIEGGQNPNTLYETSDGRKLDWRGTVNADENGFVNLGTALKAGEGSVAYVTRIVESEKDWMARLSVGADYWIRGWVNGKQVFNVEDPKTAPKPWAYKEDVLLKKGRNVITFKVGSGGKGFGFWADISEVPNVGASALEVAGDASEAEAGKAPLYNAPLRPFDPYEYHYW